MGVKIWIVIAVIFAVIEIIIPSLITIWLALAALPMVFLTPLIASPTTEGIIFLIISTFFLFVTRPIYKNFSRRTKKKYNAEMKGTIIVIKNVTGDNSYEVEFKGAIWTALSKDTRDLFSIGDKVEIAGYVGNKILIEKINHSVVS